MILSKSMAQGYVPVSYRLSHIFPFHKKDSKSIPSNYRPVSLTSHIINVFKKVIRKKIEENDLIYGFRTGHSCLTQLFIHYDDVLNSLTNFWLNSPRLYKSIR